LSKALLQSWTVQRISGLTVKSDLTTLPDRLGPLIDVGDVGNLEVLLNASTELDCRETSAQHEAQFRNHELVERRPCNKVTCSPQSIPNAAGRRT
jgi:hypothetical protein